MENCIKSKSHDSIISQQKYDNWTNRIIKENKISFYFDDDDFPIFSAYVLISETHFYDCTQSLMDQIETIAANPELSKLFALKTFTEVLKSCIQNRLKTCSAEIKTKFFRIKIVPFLIKLNFLNSNDPSYEKFDTGNIAGECLRKICLIDPNFIVKKVFERFSTIIIEDDGISPNPFKFSCLHIQFTSLGVFLTEAYAFIEKKKGGKLYCFLSQLKNFLIEIIFQYREAFNKNIQTPDTQTDEIVRRWLKYLFKLSETVKIRPFSMPLTAVFIFLSREYFQSLNTISDCRLIKVADFLDLIEKHVFSLNSQYFEISLCCLSQFCLISLYVNACNIKYIETFIENCFTKLRAIFFHGFDCFSWMDSNKIPIVADCFVVLLSSSNYSFIIREFFANPQSPALFKSAFLKALLFLMDKEKSFNHTHAIALVSEPMIYSNIYMEFIGNNHKSTSSDKPSTVKGLEYRNQNSVESVNTCSGTSDKNIIIQLYEMCPKLCLMPCNLYSNYDLSDLFLEIKNTFFKRQLDVSLKCTKLLVEIHKEEYIKIWISDHPFCINNLFGALCDFYMDISLPSCEIAGFINFMIKIYHLRHKINFSQINIRLNYKEEELLQNIFKVEIFLYFCMLRKTTNITNRIFPLFGCLYNELNLIKSKHENLIHQNQEIYEYYKKISNSLSNWQGYSKTLTDFFKILGTVSFSHQSIVKACKIFIGIIKKCSNNKTSISTNDKQLVAISKNDIMSEFYLTPKRIVSSFTTSLSFLISSTCSLSSPNNSDSGHFLELLFRNLVALLDKNTDAGSDLEIHCLLRSCLIEKLNNNLFPMFIKVVLEVSQSSKSENPFTLFNNMSKIIFGRIKDISDFRRKVGTDRMNDLILSFAQVDRSRTNTISNILYQNRVALIIENHLDYLNDSFDENCIPVKNNLFVTLINWVSPNYSCSKRKTMDRFRTTTLSYNTRLPPAIDKLAIFTCICKILQGFKIEIGLAKSCKFQTKREFLEHYSKLFISYSAFSEMNSDSLKLSHVLCQCLGNLIMSNDKINIMYLLGFSNDYSDNNIWIHTVMIFRYLFKIGYIETLTCNSFAQSYDILVEILTFEEDNQFPVLSYILDLLNDQQKKTNMISSIIALFSSQGKLKGLLKQIFQKEIDLSQDHNTIFRSSSLPVSFLASSLKIYGETFVKIFFETLTNYLSLDPTKSFEIDQSRAPNEDVTANIKNLIHLTQFAMSSLLCLSDVIPIPLVNVCSCLFDAIFKKYPNFALTSASSIFFLRLINPFLINPKISSSSIQHNKNQKRALLVLSKVLQSIANQVLNKEPSMEPLNFTVQSKFSDMKSFTLRLCKQADEEFSTVSAAEIKNMVHIQNFITPRISHLLKFLYRNSTASKLAIVTKKLQDLSNLKSGSGSIIFPLEENQNIALKSLSLKSREMDEYTIQSVSTLNLSDIIFVHGKSNEDHVVLYLDLLSNYPETLNRSHIKHYVVDVIKNISGFWDLVINCLKVRKRDIILEQVIVELQNHENESELKINQLRNIFVINLSANTKFFLQLPGLNIANFLENKNLMFINSNFEINNFISPENLPILFTSFFPVVKSTFIGTYFQKFTMLKFIETGIILKYRNTCSFRKKVVSYSDYFNFLDLQNIERLCRNTIKFKLKDSESFYFTSNQCGEIMHSLAECLSPEILKNTTVSLDTSVYDSLGACLSAALILIFYNDQQFNKICLKYFKCLYKLIDNNPTQSNIFEFDPSELSLKSATDLNEIISKSHKFLTFGLLTQTLSFLKKSNTSLQIYCLQIMSPWILNVAESIERCNSQEKIKILRLINHFINISLSHSNLIYDINLHIWSQLSKCLMLAQFVMKSFLKIIGSYSKDLKIINCLFVSLLPFAESFKIELTNYVLEILESYIETDCCSRNSEITDEQLNDCLNIHLKLLNFLLKQDRLHLLNILPNILYFAMLHLSMISRVSITAASFSLIPTCFEKILEIEEIKFPEKSIENILLMKENVTNLLKTKLNHDKVLSTNVVVDELSYNSNIELICNISTTITSALTACASSNQQLDWIQNYNKIVLKFAFSGHQSIQAHTLVLFAISDDISNISLQKLILTIGLLVKYKDKRPLNSSLFALQKYLKNIGNDLDVLFMLLWISLYSLMMLDPSLYYHSLNLLEMVLNNLATLTLNGFFETLAMGYLEKYDKYQSINSVMKYTGINFETSFHFSLAALVIKGLRANSCLIRNKSISILKLLLKMTSIRKSDSSYIVDIRSIPYYISLISLDSSIDCSLLNENKNADDSYFYIGNCAFNKNLKSLDLAPVLCIIILIKNIEYSTNFTGIYHSLLFLKFFCHEFPESIKTCNNLVESILFQRSLILNDKLISSLILNILQIANQPSQTDSQNLNLISGKGFFGFISIISNFQKTTSIIAWEQFSLFCTGLVKEEIPGQYIID